MWVVCLFAAKMVRHYKRKSSKGLYSSENMKSAVEAVLNGTKYMTAAKQFQVDRMTLKRYVNIHRSNPSYEILISTCLYTWLISVDELKMAKTVTLYCDCCSGQNRNRIVVAMLRYALSNCNYIETVHLKFLLSSHTYMPVDSIHATIEHFVRKRVVWAPSEWPTVIRSAWIDPEPYTVVQMPNDSFLNWCQIQRTIMPSKCASDVDNHSLWWKHVRAIAITKSSAKFEVRYSMLKDTVTHTFSFPRCSYISGPKQLYRQTLSTAAPKYRDLQHMCATSVIPGEFHQQFLGLTADCAVHDCLPETDDEDDVV